MDQPEQNIATSTQLPKSQVQATTSGDTFDTSGSHIFDVDKVSCYYSAFRAVTDVSLKIHEHEITAFIGPSGCGKTTVLRTLNRMNDLIPGAHVEGDIRYRGASRCAGASGWSSRSRTRSRSRSSTTSPTGRASTASTIRPS